MTQSTDAVVISKKDGVATITMNRPETLNAWSKDISEGLTKALHSVAADDEVRSAIITGAGRAFSAGADLKNPATHKVEDAIVHLEQNPRGNPIFGLLENFPKPIMAAVNGYSIGIGGLIPLSCDFVYYGRSGKFQCPQVGLGIILGPGGALRLARLVGYLNAGEIMLSGRMISADEALAKGIASRVLPDDELLPTAQQVMAEIANKPQLAVSFARESLKVAVESNDLRGSELSDFFRYLILAQGAEAARQHEDWRQGIRRPA